MEKEKKKSYFSEAIILALLPVIAYSVAFSYEKSYLGYFGILPFLAKVTYESFFIAFGEIISLILSFTLLLQGIFILWPEKLNKHLRLYFLLIFIILMNMFLLKISGNITDVLTVSIFPMLMILLYYVFPIFSKDGNSYNERLENSFKRERPIIEKGLFSRIERSVGTKTYLIIIFTLIVLPLLSGSLGYMNARKQSVFMITEIDGKQYALLRSYNDYSILAESDKIWITLYQKRNKFNNKYLLRYEFRDFSSFKKDIVIK